MTTMQVEWAFDMSSPMDERFKTVVAINEQENAMQLFSNRNGVWEPEKKFGIGDVMMPHYHMNEWDITKLKPDDPEYVSQIEV